MLKKLLATLFIAAYIASPYDLVPDMIPVFGQTDDIFLLFLLIFLLFRLKDQGKTFKGSKKYGKFKPNKSRPWAVSAGRGRPNPYDVLNLPPDATPDEIRRAYREISQKYHPDKVSHLGAEFRDIAEKKFNDIQMAYEVLRKKGGW